MNENKRILLLALGIMAILASDPPVATVFGQPHSVCSVARDLAVSVFDSLVRSTLPLSSELTEIERTEEILVAGTTVSEPARIDRPTKLSLMSAVPATARRSESAVVTELRILSAAPALAKAACNGSSQAVSVLRVEAVMNVSGQAIQDRG